MKRERNVGEFSALLLLLMLLLLLTNSTTFSRLANNCPVVAQLQVAPDALESRFCATHWHAADCAIGICAHAAAAHLMSRACGAAQQLSHLLR